MKFYTIGYGERKPEDFVDLLKLKGIKTIIDVRLRPDRARIGSYKFKEDSDRDIRYVLSAISIEYVSLIELGNIFKTYKDWRVRYKQFIDRVGDILIERLMTAVQSHLEPYCLMCCEKRASDCHRKILADYLVKQGHEVEHIE